MKIPVGSPKRMAAALASVLFLSNLSALRAADAIVESEREIPVAYDVDVVVVGGTVGAVTAAVEAAEQGASVFLAAPRPYLGEDVAGTLRMWLEEGEEAVTPLEKQVFERTAPISGFRNTLDYTYEADQPASPKHKDPKNTVLSDGTWETAAHHSVQYDADTTITADFGGSRRLKELHLLTYDRAGDFEVGQIEVETSPNGKLWRDLGTVEKNQTSEAGGDSLIKWSLTVKQPSRYVRVHVKRAPEVERVLLGELIFIEDGVEEVTDDNTRPPSTPMQVKIALDEALLAAGVQYLYGAMVTDVLEDSEGNPAGIVIANRSGRQAVKGKVIIDATARALAAREAGAEFRP